MNERIEKAKKMLELRDCAKDDLDLLKVMIILKESFRTVGHLFVECVDCGIKWDYRLALTAVYSSYDFLPLAIKAEEQGEQLFRFLLGKNPDTLYVNQAKLEIACQEGSKLNNEAQMTVSDFIEKGLSPRLFKECLEIWNEYYSKNSFYLATNCGRIKVGCILKLFRKHPFGGSEHFLTGNLGLNYHLDGRALIFDTFVGNSKRQKLMLLKSALPGNLDVSVKLPVNDQNQKLLFKFLSIFSPRKFMDNQLLKVTSVFADGESAPEYEATLQTHFVRGDLHRIPTYLQA